ncbi:MAG: arginine--tRNA ligase [Alphaproteobacteria bacterium]|jgi:arginyl-tRNA synthetase|nr:arginine--tRNA ligase [Alphaproteobacteria bacterium]MDP6590631.1 arginine--tRNA ligase [Alphaproteobacteria bacterium]MDP6818415.1 arginine--tRNA ligase [Alphaproteobacteria bacterium]
MNVFKELLELVKGEIEHLSEAGELPAGLDFKGVLVEPPRDPEHGDMATNAAMVLAKRAGKKPHDIAALLADRLAARGGVASVEVAGPGFINLRLDADYWHGALKRITAAGEKYGAFDMGRGKKVNVEFVSANPTGPLHVGHGRGTVFGDVLAALLERVGYDVTREYYVNDAGAQVDALARSVHQRYLEALGCELAADAFEDGYPGDYLVPVGAALARQHGEKYAAAPESEWFETFRAFAVESMLSLIRDDLAALGVRHDVFSSEKKLVDDGQVQACFADLQSRDLIYRGVLEPPKGKPPPEDWEPRPQHLFRATSFGDEVDRPLKKSDGGWTYFATDIAYHRAKFERGFEDMIDVWGADHGGYVKRMKAAVSAVSGGSAALDVKLCQMVKLTEGGRPVTMSKRSGQFVTLRDVVDKVGKDVVRFIMLTRKNDAPLEFDLARALEQSKDNPVFYVQYAHARIRSVVRRAEAEMPEALATDIHGAEDLSMLTDAAEIDLIKCLCGWPRAVDSAVQSHEPHRLAFYLQELAAAFHLLWNKGNENHDLRFIIPGDGRVTAARLTLIGAVAQVISLGLGIFAVRPVEEMR